MAYVQEETRVSGQSGQRPPRQKSVFREYVESIGLALLAALFIRHFFVEAFKIPSSSMVPTLLVGDHLFVNKLRYGVRLPFTKRWLARFAEPKRGEVLVFMYPRDEGKNFIKRVVGLPGDTIELRDNDLYVNGRLQKRVPLENTLAIGVGDYFLEDTAGVKHVVRYEFGAPLHGRFGPVKVPPGHIFMMGDNRDNSSDSREWGPVPMENIKGRALFIWFSIARGEGRGGPGFSVRWERLGRMIR